jgi:hypothetical protein
MSRVEKVRERPSCQAVGVPGGLSSRAPLVTLAGSPEGVYDDKSQQSHVWVKVQRMAKETWPKSSKGVPRVSVCVGYSQRNERFAEVEYGRANWDYYPVERKGMDRHVMFLPCCVQRLRDIRGRRDLGAVISGLQATVSTEPMLREGNEWLVNLMMKQVRVSRLSLHCCKLAFAWLACPVCKADGLQRECLPVQQNPLLRDSWLTCVRAM